MINKLKNPANLLLIALFIGTIYAYTSVFIEFIDFYAIEGTIFKISECVTPNPVTTPCFYGAFGFLLAAIWAYKIKNNEITKKITQYFYLTLFLLGGTIFAWYNNYATLFSYFFEKKESFFGCTGKIITNPFITPCFIGATIFTISLGISILVLIKLKKSNKSI